MASCETVSDHLSSFLAETGQTEKDIKLVQFLNCYLVAMAEGKDTTACFVSNDSRSVLSLLIQQLLKRFGGSFLNGSSETKSQQEEESLKGFLQQEDVLLLLATICHICTQVDYTHLELVELLIVVLRNLSSTVAMREASADLFLHINPAHSYANDAKNKFRPLPLVPEHPHLNEPHPLQLLNSVPAVGPETMECISDALLNNQTLSGSLDDIHLYLLILGVIEGLSCRCVPKSNGQLSSSLQILTQLTGLLEELVLSWLQIRNVPETTSSQYLGVALFSRLILRMWLILVNNSASSLLSPSHISDLRSLLSRPVAMVTKVSNSLAKDCLFKTNRFLDSEFTFLFLESLYVSLSAINTFVCNPLVPAESLMISLQEVIFDTSQEWLVYLCSKLQSITRSTSHWDTVIESTHLLLARLMREMIVNSDHIHSCQKAAKSNLLIQQDTTQSVSRSVSYSLETSMGFDKLEQRLCKISQSLLSIFENVPSIQLLALQLLAQTGLDKVGIIADFLPRVAHSSVWSMPEVLDLYLELLEKAWLHLSPDFAGSTDFWSKVGHYATPLSEGSCQTILQVMYHLLFLFSHRSCYLISALTQHVMLKYHQHAIEDFKAKLKASQQETGVVTGKIRQSFIDVRFQIEEEKVIHMYLKLLQKMSAHPSSLVPFLENQHNLFALFLFLPLIEFRMEALTVFCHVLQTLCKPWEASVLHSNQLSGKKTHYHLINSLLQLAYEFHEGNLVAKCDRLSSTGATAGPFDLRKVDEVHVTIQSLLDNTEVGTLVEPSLIQHLSLISDVWRTLADSTGSCEGLISLVNENQVWDVIQVLAPSLASLLERIHVWCNEGEESMGVALLNRGDLVALQEICVSLLCHLLSMATIVCRVREDPLKVLEVHCSEVHSFLCSSRICTVPNGHSYIATLLKTACFYSQDQSDRSSNSSFLSQRNNSYPSTEKQVNDNKGSPVISRRQSKIRPLSLPMDVKLHSKPVKRVNPAVALSPGNRLRLFFPTALDVAGDESDYSGYEGDTELGVASTQWEDCGVMDEIDEEAMATGGGGSLRSPVTTVKVPEEVKRRLWLESPVWQCLELLRECLDDPKTVSKCESCLELFLAYLLQLIKADQLNLELLAGKGILGLLLDTFSPLFDSKSERSKNCQKILCQIVEVLASYQLSHSDARKLLLKLQNSKENLEQLVLVLHRVAEQTHSSHRPSSYIKFSYSRPLLKLNKQEMLTLPNPRPTGLQPCTLSLWLSITRYPLASQFHLVSIFCGDIYVQLWGCGLSGDIKLVLSDQLKLTCLNEIPGTSSVTVGSALTLNTFHHLYLSIKPVSKQMQLLLVIDGGDVYDYHINLPSSLAKYNEEYCYLSGGAVSNHTAEKYIRLMQADQTSLSWRLGSLHVFEGSCGVNLANLLYQLGPECPPSSISELQDILTSSYLEVSDTTVINQAPITDQELYFLQWPFISYSAHQSQQVFLVSMKEARDSEGIASVDTTPRIMRIPYVHQLQWVSTAYAINQPQLLDVLQNCIGLEQLIYLYAKIVSDNCSDEAQAAAISLIRLAANHSPYSKMEFRQLGGIKLLQQVLRTGHAALSKCIADVFLNWCCGSDRQEVSNLDVLEHILLDWHIWYRSPVDVWQMLLLQLEELLSPDNTHAKLNQAHFSSAQALVKILLTSKERSSMESSYETLDSSIATLFVRLIGLLLGDPPALDCLKYIWDHLLLPDLHDLKVVRGGVNADVSSSLIEATNLISKSSPHASVSSMTNTLESQSSSRLMPDTPTDSQYNGIDRDVRGEEEDEDSDLEVLEFDVRSCAGRLPDSSYTDLETLFTWTDITGIPFPNENEATDSVPVSVETGLLSLIRKVICLLPDSQVKKVFGPIFDQESIVVMANNSSILVRTAVVRVLDEFFRRAGESSQANFLQVKGFNLLGVQLKQYSVSFQLIGALFSIVLGQEINLYDQSSPQFQMPQSLSKFQLHAVIPILVCTVNTSTEPMLCHSTLCMSKELFEMVKGMPPFMLNNGLLKMLCQMIAITPESSSLSRDNKNTLLNDLFGFCKLVVLYTLSAEQEEIFKYLESFLVCLRHCSEELKKNRGSHSLTVIYLNQFIYLILVESLSFFSTGPIGESGIISPLHSCLQVANQADLNYRFIYVCTMAVDWFVHDTGPFSASYVSAFAEGRTISRSISFDRKVSPVAMVTGYIRFLMQYFNRAIYTSLKKATNPLDVTPLRFFVQSRAQLNECYSRCLGYLFSSVHVPQFNVEILKEFHSFNDYQSVLNSLFSSQYKKLLCGRLVLTIVNVMSSRDIQPDSRSMTAFNDLFDIACGSGLTRLKQSNRLSSLLNLGEEEDSRTRQKIEGVMEELKSADQRWLDRTESGKKDFDHRQLAIYQNMLEKIKSKEQSVNRASAQVTDRVFVRQKDLKKNLIEQIEMAGVQEENTLRQWKKIIMANTHPRAIWCNDEGRPLCWQLDPTEGPSRVRRRLRRAPRDTDEKFLLPEACTKPSKGDSRSPLSFIFEETAYDSAKGLFMKIVRQPDEEIISNYPQRCYIISPDSCCVGHLLISNFSCHFIGDEPLGDPNITKVVPLDEKTQLMSWRHMDVVEIHRRRYMLKDNALEIFLINGITLLLSFDTTSERNKVHSGLLELDMPNLVDLGEGESSKLRVLTSGWQHGEITNFEYLMELNKLAGRTFNDLMQYPVFPFILSDYTSEELDLTRETTFRILERPISIQDDSKVQKYINTYEYIQNECTNQGFMMPGLSSISSKPYHYGSHYSNSGIVLHFLVRIPPFTNMFIDFQGKSFDIADRSFHKMATTWWLSSSESATDVKELIPEFFYFPEFLTNAERFNFGEKQSGDVVDDVILPPWAKGDPRLFVLKHRQALESEYVSRHLHQWIDLVFGFKQTGKAAVNAINVFHPATYYGADGIDVDSIDDPTQQEALKTMVKTYGQMPLQLFKEPHLARSKSTVRTTLLIRFGSMLKRLTSSSSGPFKVINPHIQFNLKIIRPKVTIDCEFIGIPEPQHSHRPMVTTMVPCSPERLVCLWNGEVATTELNAAFFPSPSQTYHSLLVTWGHWDNALVVRLVGMEPITLKLHNSPLNKITCCQCVCNGQVLVSAGSSGVVSFWKLTNTSKQRLSYAGEASHLRGHDGAVNCLVACKPYSIVVSGSADGTCIIWDTNRLCYVNMLGVHEGPVTCLAISPTLGDIAVLCKAKRDPGTPTTEKSVCVLNLWTINGRLIKTLHSSVPILSLCYTSAPEGVYVNVIIGGLANGKIKFWSSWDLSELCELPSPGEQINPVLSLAVSSCSTKLYAGYSNQQVVTWVKPETTIEESGDYVLVNAPASTPFLNSQTTDKNTAAHSTTNVLRYF